MESVACHNRHAFSFAPHTHTATQIKGDQERSLILVSCVGGYEPNQTKPIITITKTTKTRTITSYIQRPPKTQTLAFIVLKLPCERTVKRSLAMRTVDEKSISNMTNSGPSLDRISNCCCKTASRQLLSISSSFPFSHDFTKTICLQ